MRLLSDAELLLVAGADAPPALSTIDSDTSTLINSIGSAGVSALHNLITGQAAASTGGAYSTVIANWDNSATGEWAQHSSDPAVQAWLDKLGQDVSANPWTQAVHDDVNGLKSAALADGAVNDETGNGSGPGNTTYGGTGAGGSTGHSTYYGGGGYTPDPGDEGWS
jgi:hypothetical protein